MKIENWLKIDWNIIDYYNYCYDYHSEDPPLSELNLENNLITDKGLIMIANSLGWLFWYFDIL